jgi:hypothetical protein
MSFPLYTEFLPELQGVVRQQCVPSDRCMLTMTCKREYDAATVEDRTRYWRRVTAEGDPEGKMRAWIHKQPEDVPLAKLVTLAVDALEAKSVEVFQWLTTYYMDKCPSRRIRMPFEEVRRVLWEPVHADSPLEEKVRYAWNVTDRHRDWHHRVQIELGFRGDRETWQFCVAQKLYMTDAIYGPFTKEKVTDSFMIGLCKAGHLAWIQEVLNAGFDDLEYYIVYADNADMLHAWYETHGPGWDRYHIHRMLQSGAVKCLRYYLSHGGVLEHNCIYWALCGTAETCATVIPFLIKQGVTWDMATLESLGMSRECRPWLEYLRQRQAQ